MLLFQPFIASEKFAKELPFCIEAWHLRKTPFSLFANGLIYSVLFQRTKDSNRCIFANDWLNEPSLSVCEKQSVEQCLRRTYNVLRNNILLNYAIFANDLFNRGMNFVQLDNLLSSLLNSVKIKAMEKEVALS